MAKYFVILMLLAAACDLPPGWRNDKGSLVIALPGASTPDAGTENFAALGRALGSDVDGVHLPGEITSDMEYEIYFSGSTSISIPRTRERVITIDLEPGLWGISVTAWHPASLSCAGEAWVKDLDIQAGRTNFVSLTMKADDFLAPWGAAAAGTKDVYADIGDLITLQVEVNSNPSLADDFAAWFGTGWVNTYEYQWYYEDESGTRYDETAPDNLSVPNVFSFSPNTSAAGYRTYYVELTNTYTYAGSVSTVSGTAKVTVKAAVVEVSGSPTRSLGDSGPGGGTIFYKGPRFYVNGELCHYLEAGPDLGTAQWGLDGIYTGTYNYGIGSGYANTQAILAALNRAGELSDTPSNKKAAQLAADYNGGGGWFLPGADELRELYASGPFGLYSLWSSIESGDRHAALILHTDGQSQWPSKCASFIVRPV
ncbi:MAG: hypothetical protein LBH73_06035, partial [Spirochaetaceae bacterium]|nr:hypothetical protein [Spirochaetaceae bacterium]